MSETTAEEAAATDVALAMDEGTMEIRVETPDERVQAGDMLIVAGSYGIHYHLSVFAVLGARMLRDGAFMQKIRAKKRPVWVNADALTSEQQAAYKRRPRNMGRLCWSGYHLPEHPEPDHYLQCKGAGCRCYCHNPERLEQWRGRITDKGSPYLVLARDADGTYGIVETEPETTPAEKETTA